MKSKIRDSRIELLRIISMVLIVVSHFSLESVSYWTHTNTPIEAVKLMYFDVLGQPGAIVFFIITGFFYCTSSNFDNQKKKAVHQIWKTWIKTFCYSIFILVIAWKYIAPPTLKQVVTAVLPFSFNEYWFITCYIIVIATAPWLNKLIDSMSSKEFQGLLLLLFILMFPALLKGGILNNLLLAFSGYLTGAFIKKHAKLINSVSVGQLLLVFIIDYFIMLLSIFISKFIGISTYHSAHFTHFPLSYILAICIFLLILKMKSFKVKWINILASGAFAVYLITVNPLFYVFLWKNIVRIEIYQHMGLLIPFIMIIISIMIYLVCAGIDIGIMYILNLCKGLKKNNNNE